MLPKHVHRVTSGKRVYYIYQAHRNTPRAGPRTRILSEPGTAEFFAEIEAASQKGRGPKDGTVDALIAAYRAGPKYRRLKPNTVRDYDFYLGILSARFGPFDARAITTPHMQALYDALLAEGTPVKARKCIAVASTVFSFGLPRALISQNPAVNVELEPHKPEQAKPWPRWAVRASQFVRWELRAFVALAIYTGQRTSDIVRMGWSDIRGDKIRVVTEKTGKELWIPIHKNLRPVLQECRARGGETFIFGGHGQPMTPDVLRAMFERARDGRKGKHQEANPFARLRSERLTPHGLRSLAVVHLLELGLSEEDVGAVTGQTPQTVRHYAQGQHQSRRAEVAIATWEASVDEVGR